MKWEEVCESKELQDLPFKIELNKWGQIVMSPVKIRHSFYQGEILFLLRSFLEVGIAMPECAITTTEGVKVADVVWCSHDRFKQIREDSSASIAPEICVEVISASNTLDEMVLKKELYFEAQAIEVWLCDIEGNLTFYNHNKQLDKSLLVPNFPDKINYLF